MDTNEILNIIVACDKMKIYLGKLAYEIGMVEDSKTFDRYDEFCRVEISADQRRLTVYLEDGDGDTEHVCIPFEQLGMPREEMLKMAEMRRQVRIENKAILAQKEQDRLKADRRGYYLKLKEEFAGDA